MLIGNKSNNIIVVFCWQNRGLLLRVQINFPNRSFVGAVGISVCSVDNTMSGHIHCNAINPNQIVSGSRKLSCVTDFRTASPCIGIIRKLLCISIDCINQPNANISICKIYICWSRMQKAEWVISPFRWKYKCVCTNNATVHQSVKYAIAFIFQLNCKWGKSNFSLNQSIYSVSYCILIWNCFHRQPLVIDSAMRIEYIHKFVVFRCIYRLYKQCCAIFSIHNVIGFI